MAGTSPWSSWVQFTWNDIPSIQRQTLKDRLSKVPLELLIDLLEYLPYESQVAFSLTSKKLYGLLFRRIKPEFRRHHGREVYLLYLLERDLPAHLTCSIHERLYNWKEQWQQYYKCPLCVGSGRRGFRTYDCCINQCPNRTVINEAERRLLIRSSELGSRYGINHRSVKHICDDTKLEPDTTHARIVSGKLMIRKTWSQMMSVGPVGLPAAWLLSDYSWLKHVLCARHYEIVRASEAMHIIASSMPTPASTELAKLDRVFRCFECASDRYIKITQFPPRSKALTDYLIEIDIYEDLGGLGELTIRQKKVLERPAGRTRIAMGRWEMQQSQGLREEYFGDSGITMEVHVARPDR